MSFRLVAFFHSLGFMPSHLPEDLFYTVSIIALVATVVESLPINQVSLFVNL